MKIFRKSLFLVLALLILSAILSVSAATVDSGTCGENLKWTLSDKGVLKITGEGDMYFTEVPWKGKEIKKVEIGDGVTYITDKAFAECTELTSISIPDSASRIGYSVFMNCTSLESITLPDTLTFLGAESFSGCTALKSITIPGGVKSIYSETFKGCTVLETVTLSEGVTTLNRDSFSGCTALKAVKLPSSLETIRDSAFYGCASLTDVYIPANVYSIGSSVFTNCTSLKEITVAAENTKYASVDGALYKKDKTKLLYFPAGITGEIVLPDGLVDIDSGAFTGCTGLTKITIPATVYNIGWRTFRTCTSLEAFEVAEGCPFLTAQDGVLYDNRSLFCCPPAKTGKVTLKENTASIEDSAFYGCSGITSVVFSEKLSAIGDYAFYGCSKLESIELPEKLQYINDYAFAGCSSLRSVHLPAAVYYVSEGAFSDCTELEKITVDPANTSLQSVDGILYNKALTAIVCCPAKISGDVTIPEGVISIDPYAFSGCAGLTSIKLSESVTTICEGAFSGCSGLKSFTLPNGMTDVKAYTFSGCTNLTEVTLPDTIVNVYGRAFAGCTSLKSITFPEGLQNITGYAFDNCTSLSSVTIPKSVTGFAGHAFNNSGLKTIIFEGDKPSENYTNTAAFAGVTATAFYPADNSTWTSAAMDDLAQGGNITWKAYKPGETPWNATVEITKQPKTTYTALGEKAKFTVKAEGEGLKYQWYYKDVDGKKYKKCSGTEATYSLEMTEARKDRKLYCKITDEYGNSVKTKTVTMKMAASIKTQPKTQYVQLDEKAKFTVKAVGDDLTYQWYYKSAGSSKYKKASCTKATYTITMTEDRKDRKFYCIVTDKKGNEVKSKTVTMKMAASIKTEPKSVTTSIGKKAKFSVEAVGDGLTYQWYYKDTDSKKYKKASCTKATYSIELTKARNGRKFYCVVTDKYGNEVKTKTVSMKKK